MTLYVLSALFAIFSLFALWNGYTILWKTVRNKARSKHYSKVWHKIGFVVRGLLIAGAGVLLYYFASLSLLVLSLVLLSNIIFLQVWYDLVINAVRYFEDGKPDLWYVDNKGFNAFFLKFLSPKAYWITRIAVTLILNIVLLILTL